VFAVQVGATLYPGVSRAQMQDYAQVARGFYQYASSYGDVARAFDRMATRLRRPPGYELTMATSFREEPPASRKPGTISVVPPPDDPSVAAIGSDVGVEIILDTSGSMLRRAGGRRRIDVAKEVLADLVERQLPIGTPVALRVLGSRDDPCGTSLAVPLQPLDPAAVTALVNGIEVVQEADTPLGAAIAAVPDDLAESAGTRILLVITDSQEVWPHRDLCGMDPAVAIRNLGRRGIDARLNIVGFGLTNRRAKTQLRRWARLGNGSYFDARNNDQLGRAIRQAVSAPFRVYDAAGNEVASGTVGGSPVPVPPGTYSVVVLTDPVARFDGVEIAPDGGVSLTLPIPEPPSPDEPAPAAASP
jgi:Ca-activated chloride channel family protein